MTSSKPITNKDTIRVRGKHLYKSDGTPFTVKGIAFPTPPETATSKYDAKSWLAVLHQLRDLDLEFNTIRLYRLESSVDYSEFFKGAAELGVYVIVPLTSAEGQGVLDRNLPANKCYKPKLFVYGARSVREYLNYPNILAGTVGNEVMNDEKAWLAAPCIRSYSLDLKKFMSNMVEEGVTNRTLPLLYAAQDSATIGGATVDKDEVMKLTVDYLTCVEGSAAEEEKPIDIYGVNIESWCSSTQDYYQNPDGTVGTYYSLWQSLRQSSIPIIFSEMGCPHSQFDKDDLKRKTKEGTRDWAQIPIVTNEMSDSWSGFIAYTYDGPSDFAMFSGGPWDGEHTLHSTKDFENFKHQLHEISHVSPNKTLSDHAYSPPQCNDVEADLKSCCDVHLFSSNKMRSFATMVDAKTGRVVLNNTWFTLVAFLIAIGAASWIQKRTRFGKDTLQGISLRYGIIRASKNGYGAIS